jgi:hypothetical protein
MNKLQGVSRPATAAPAVPATSAGRTVWRSLAQRGRISGLVVTAAPTVVFVVADAMMPLTVALVVAGATAVAGFAWRLSQRQSLRGALTGLLLVAACAAVAAVTGQERGFFLIPALIPFVVVAVCAGSVLAGRPLTGVILNRVAGGPAQWRDIAPLRRVYVVSTVVCAAVNVVNAAVQTVFYLANEPVVLAAAHVATGPVFAVIVGVTVVFARRAMPRSLPG